MEFYRRCLIQIFGILEDYEVRTEGQTTLLESLPEDEALKVPPAAAFEPDGQSEEEQRRPSKEVQTPPPLASPEERRAVVKEELQQQVEPRPQQASKYDKLPIRVEEVGERWEEVEKRWAKLSRPNGFISGLLHWKAGGGDSTAHIQTHFEPRTGDFTPPEPRGRGEMVGGGKGRSPEHEEAEEVQVDGGAEAKLPAERQTGKVIGYQ